MQTTEENYDRKPSKKDLLKSFKRDLDAADTLRLEQVTLVETWRDEYHGKLYGNEQEGKSKIVSRDIKRQDEWQHASVKDPFVSDSKIVKCGPVTFEDRKAAQQNELILNHQFVRQFNRYKFMTDIIKLYYAEGTVVVKTSWDYEDEEIEEEVPVYAEDANGQVFQADVRTVKSIKVKKNRPTAQTCRIEDIYIDPTCEGDLDNAQFIIHRYESDMSTLRKAGKYKNLDKVAKSNASSDDTADFEPEDESEFRFEDTARKKLIVHEYWGNFDVDGSGIVKPIVCTWVGDTIIQLESNPYPDEALPFLILANNSIPFKIYGEANAELIGDNQKVNTAIKRGILDNMANSNNAQKGMRVGSLDLLNKRRFLNGKNFEFNGSQADFFEGSYNQIPASVFNVMEMTNNETESMLGVKAFANGGIAGSSLGSTARAAGGVLDAVSVRRLDIVRNISENLIKPLMRKWTSYNSLFLREEEVIRITNEEFVPIRRDDLAGDIDIDIEVSTAEDNSNKAQELSFLLQTLGQTMDQGMRNLLMSEIAKLHKMPDLAKMLENYQPQVDPMAEEYKKWELRKLMSEVKERDSRAEENVVDIDLKSANADLSRAKTADIISGTDQKDLDFTRIADGTQHQEKMQEKAFEHGSAIAQEKEKQRGNSLTWQ
ncbi:MAG: hypothetical protein GY820_10475 [Gammaproteobacteria bacterium]|nr:hypothetical protein [Gammaproteobacteria bacterium]